VANNGDEIAVATRLDPNDAKAVVGILIGDALNQPGQYLPSDGCDPVFMTSIVPVSSASR
jgi:hypothetical protein